MQPLSVVEHQGFRKLVNVLDPKYEIVSRKRLSTQLLPQRYDHQKKKLIEELSLVEKVSITTGCWTSRANEAYTTITAHYVDPDWNLKAPVLTTRSEGKHHMAENLASELRDTFIEFKIDKKVTTVVKDNSRNVTNAVTIIEAQHQPCFAHTLNLVVRNSLDADDRVRQVINKVKAIVTYFHSSTVATNKLREVHVSRGSVARKLKQGVETRWNSTFDMLKLSWSA
ncbi:zinc finger BED domain-containing protein 1 [Elysia marginata]|uniref:Zinc finger BED domain-containing protein 1 n=1 Tax=Elysia marginata TaxID=1093978 RepID=A0AAV4JXD9_9GAST|nr:zinc finger BED domain-containing protein 1 [Elysia marginata]